MATTTKSTDLVEQLRATTAIVRLGQGDGLTLPQEIRQSSGLFEGDAVYLEVLDEGSAGLCVRLRKIDPDQAWFWTPEWQAGEREADAAKREARSTISYSAEEFLDSLK
jgi:hypothetical protein